MNRLLSYLRENDKAQGLVEYGLILALVSVVAVGAVSGVGDKVTGTFSTVATVDETEVAPEEDFKWVIHPDPYWEDDPEGYYQYIGSDKEVRIPHKLDNKVLTSYYRMFDGTDVERVVSDNSYVTDMFGMFWNTKASHLDLSDFDTSNVTNMHNMFRDSSYDRLDLSSFDTSKVTSMRDMFARSKAKSIDLTSFDTSNVTNMWGMFVSASSYNLDVSSFDTSNVTTMYSMFHHTRNINELDLSSFDMGNVSNTNWMLYQTSAETGCARTQEDADTLNNSSRRPAGLSFTVK